MSPGAPPSFSTEEADADRGVRPGTASTATLRGAARGGSLNLVSAVCNQAALFLATGAVARYLGKVALGEYALGLAVLALVGTLALFGFQMTLTRHVAVHLADADSGRLRGTVTFGLGFSFCLSILLSACVIVFASPLATLFGSPEFAGDLRIVAVAIPAGTLRDASLAAVQGWRTQRAFALVTWVYEPLVRLVLTAAAIAAGYGLRGAFIALAFGSWTAAGLALHAVVKRLRTSDPHRPVIEARRLIRFSTVSLGTGMATVGIVWADLIFLGVLSDTGSVGVYNIATRLVNLAVFVMLPISAAFAPQFAHLLHVKDDVGLGRAYRAATTWILRLSLPAFVILLVFPDNLLRIFGPEYTAGAAVTVILLFGQLVNASVGPCGTLLNMGAGVGINMLNNISVMIFNIMLNFLLIPRWGIIGAAIAWTASLSIVNIARVIEVKIILNAMPFGVATLKSAVAAVVAAAACIGVKIGISSPVEQLAVGIATALIFFIGIQLLFGPDAEDRAFISSLIPRH